MSDKTNTPANRKTGDSQSKALFRIQLVIAAALVASTWLIGPLMRFLDALPPTGLLAAAIIILTVSWAMIVYALGRQR